MTLATGQTLDFIVGSGNDGSGTDGTILQATITSVPEPASLLTGLSMLATGGAIRG